MRKDFDAVVRKFFPDRAWWGVHSILERVGSPLAKLIHKAA